MREESLLEHVYAANAALPAGVTVPPGDDMGALTIGDQQVLVTVDQVGAGVHVALEQATLEQVGRKAITRSLSDVAAMAARPSGAVTAVSLPRRFGEEPARVLFDAMRRTAAAFGCPLMGGDISMWDHPLLISVTVLAEPAGVEPVLRRGAKVGDAIYVSGTLGGSMQTLQGYTHHLDFTPRLELARTLAENPRTRPNCLMDLSDGLGRDLPRLCRASGVCAEVAIDALPVSRAAEKAAQQTHRPAWQHAIGDGEDYELLFTAAPGVIPSSVAGVSLTSIGRVVACEGQGEGEQPVRFQWPDGSVARTAELGELGWEHRG